MSTRFGRQNQTRDYRCEGIYKHFFVTRPASGIRQMDDGAAPARPCQCLLHVLFDGTQQSRNHRGPQLDNSFRKRCLTRPARRPPRFRIEVIHGPSTQIHQIATRSLKDREKVLVMDRGVHHSERIAHRPVKPGVALIEEASGGGSRFADEQQAHVFGTKRPPQSFSLATCGIKRQRG
jgi:hypothetical protein